MFNIILYQSLFLLKLKVRLRLWQVCVCQSVPFHHPQKKVKRLQNVKLPLTNHQL